LENPAKVLIVDDETALREFLRISLSAHRYEVYEAATGEEALQMVRQVQPAGVLLDFGLPDMDGIEVTRQLRSWTGTPILFVSVRDDEQTIVRALDAGADDYLTKPFRLPELLARLRAALRRTSPVAPEGRLVCGKISLDQDSRHVTIDGQRINLTPNEFSILHELLQHQGRVVSHRQLRLAVWGEAQPAETHLLRVHISNLRKKLESFESLAEYISNEPGIGYRLANPEDCLAS
jgi:two-component system KDP operon response regulator KdpE